VLNVILGQHNKPKAAVHTAEMTGPLKKKKKKKKKICLRLDLYMSHVKKKTRYYNNMRHSE
jgi:hypothetical protein